MFCQGDKPLAEKMLPERILAICNECHAYYTAKIGCMSTLLLISFFSSFFLSFFRFVQRLNANSEYVARHIKKEEPTHR